MKKLNKPYFLGIDIGGTKIEICSFDNRYNLIDSEKISTDQFKHNSLQFLEILEELIQKRIEDSVKVIGISFNCVVNKGKITYSSLLGGYVNYPLVKKWEKKFRRKIILENDVNAMAKAEAVFGLGKKTESFVLINLGTGIRLSFYSHGRLIGGYSNNLGEISQMKYLVPELHDKETIIDSFLSGKGLAKIYQEISRQNKDAKQIFKSKNDDPDAQRAILIFTEHLYNFLQIVSYFYNPERIIINGSLKKSAEKFLTPAIEKYKKNTFKFFHFKDIVISNIDHGACLGACLIIKGENYEKRNFRIN
ncbi:hypothetical protein A2X44_02140 [candidate division CPR3 bacterium GWF2_35_18]|uniref:Transcriptional regulator/sugar kinase n=1 Tax=candidate division CPR3 bacterium GW2011_GWF2_35_18 TaxID=1618350 RepID=A0A0G0C1M1_UNCC3|nr:MAG: Transcriptional regulator/sugar kinase [candidate division CPR3 bacterium GW2011_GWF2_35_18]KKP85947.1 MAG: Transcriptional regulator/sugar kinase [candidate division CPR3 bacterium GW2011_GWE2_35_7]OGB62798.1 MAG: hypothetical protein A2X44_02140 [candidate division CPR3 bacterium GWF2_35_18]OGB65379.1 MAG: hypothetical protein A2250_00355 [candidate division CPR3 bacterium RIFOXYA2_FULL_35_13]OGB78263.1 MAG: hypothetical protein A2296_04310 [candidate division CPR3 bacterium RIFOXYB2_